MLDSRPAYILECSARVSALDVDLSLRQHPAIDGSGCASNRERESAENLWDMGARSWARNARRLDALRPSSRSYTFFVIGFPR